MEYTKSFSDLISRLKGESDTGMPSRIQELNRPDSVNSMNRDGREAQYQTQQSSMAGRTPEVLKANAKILSQIVRSAVSQASQQAFKSLKTFTSDVAEKAKRKRDAQEGIPESPIVSITSEDAQKPQAEKVGGESLSVVVSSMGDISGTLKSMSGILQNMAKDMQPEKKAAYDIEEAALENRPQASMTYTREDKEYSGPGFFDIVKSLLMNPAVIAAVAGLVYAFLPEETQKKIKAFLGGFIEGLGNANKLFDLEDDSSFSTAIKIAGGAIALYLGTKLISSVASAIGLVVDAIKLMRAGFGKLRKMGKFTQFALIAAAGAGAYVLSKELIEGNESDDDREARAEGGEGGIPPESSSAGARYNKKGEYQGDKKSALRRDLVTGKEVALKEPGFLPKLKTVSKNLGVAEADLLSVMKFESGLDPKARSPYTKATGLIGFMPKTAEDLGTTVDKLREMSATEQLDYVEKFYKNANVKGMKKGDLYVATFMPAFLKSPDDTIVGLKGSDKDLLLPNGKSSRLSLGKIYEQNRILDTNNNGNITVGELRSVLDEIKISSDVGSAIGDTRVSSAPITPFALPSNLNAASLNSAMADVIKARTLVTASSDSNIQPLVMNSGRTIDTGTVKKPDIGNIPSPVSSRGSLDNGAVHYSRA